MDDAKKAGRKRQYRWNRVQDGRWHTFRRKDVVSEGENAFSCNSQSFVSLLHRRAEVDGLRVETRTDGDSVKFRFVEKGVAK